MNQTNLLPANFDEEFFTGLSNEHVRLVLKQLLGQECLIKNDGFEIEGVVLSRDVVNCIIGTLLRQERETIGGLTSVDALRNRLCDALLEGIEHARISSD